MKNKNLISSILSLFFTFFLLITCILAWYTNNKNVSANGIIGSSAGDNYSLKLQRGYYDKENNSFEWEYTESLTFSNISPGNKFFFRIEIDAEVGTDYSFTATIDDISSSLIEDKLVINEGYVCSKEGEASYSKLYKIEDNKVTFKDEEDNIRTLYNCVNNEVNLDEFLIHNTFKFYNIGTIEPQDTNLESYANNPLVETSFDITVIDADDKVYYYFALEFNEEDSIETMDGLECSNCYMYQKLSIGYIEIKYNK